MDKVLVRTPTPALAVARVPTRHLESVNYGIDLKHKNDFMKKIKWPVLLVTAFAVSYQFTPYLGFSDQVIISLFMISPIPVLWMAYKILKDGLPSGRTFDEYFYDDLDYTRNKIR